MNIESQNLLAPKEYLAFTKDNSKIVFLKAEEKIKKSITFLKSIGDIVIKEGLQGTLLIKEIEKKIKDLELTKEIGNYKISMLFLQEIGDRIYITKFGGVDFTVNDEFITETTLIENTNIDNYLNNKIALSEKNIYFTSIKKEKTNKIEIISFNKKTKFRNVVIKNI